MHKILTFLFTASLTVLLGGCIKDSCEKMYSYTYYQPVYKTTAEVRNNIRSNKPRAVENPGKLFILGNYIFLNEVDKGVHVIDNSNPSAPNNVAFIDIPGNLDLAVKGNILYADLYTDLVTIDIAAPLAIRVLDYTEGVFPHRSYGYGFGGDTNKIITNWIQRDTVVRQDCQQGPIWYENYMDASFSSGNKSVSSSPVGKGGSMARFTLMENHLFTVSFSGLHVFNIRTPEKPVYLSEVQIENLQLVETIYPLGDKLFIGAQNGMNIYDVSNPAKPVLTGKFAHVQSCDPVISDGKYAYVTLRSGTACRGFTNQLEILQLNHIVDPTLVSTYPMSNPHGLSKDGDLLFICDGADGVKMYDAKNVRELRLLHHVKGLTTYDVIAMNGLALIVAKEGLHQYDYRNGKMRFLSKVK